MWPELVVPEAASHHRAGILALQMSLAESHSGSRPLAILLLERLRHALKRAGWDVKKDSRKAGAGSPDLVASKGRRRYVVELKVAREPRRPELQAMLAAAFLQSRVYANKLGAVRSPWSERPISPTRS